MPVVDRAHLGLHAVALLALVVIDWHVDHLILGAILRPLFWLVVLGLALWAVRRALPDFEEDLFEKGPIDGIRGIIRTLRRRAQDRRVHRPEQ